MQNKNKKISISLKKYHHKKRTRLQRNKELKVISWLIIFTAIIGIYFTKQIIKPVEAQAPYARMNATFPIAKEKELLVRDKIIIEAQKACNKHNLDENCVNDLLAMSYTESRFNDKAVGDKGMSHGILQIHLGYHPSITVEQAEDISFSINWTLNRLIANHYPEYRSNAVRRHNGSPTNPKTLKYLQAVNSFALN